MPFLTPRASKTPMRPVPAHIRQGPTISSQETLPNPTPESYTFVHSESPVLPLKRTGRSFTEEVTTTILELADGARRPSYCINGHAAGKAAIRAGGPKSCNTSSPSSSDQNLSKGKDGETAMSEEAAADLENAVPSQSATPATRRSGETFSSKGKHRQQRPPLRSAQSMTSANRWRSLNGNAPAKVPTDDSNSNGDRNSDLADDLNESLFRRMVVDDLTASSVALGPVADQSDDNLWHDPEWDEKSLVKPYWKGDEFGGR